MFSWQKPKESEAETEGLWKWPVPAMQSNVNTDRLPGHTNAATIGSERTPRAMPRHHTSERFRKLREVPPILPFLGAGV